MPDREDMPGIILTLSETARDSGIKFDLIEPVVGNSPPSGSFATERIHLLFNGDFYGLSDFLYRIRSLVAVRNGELQAARRLKLAAPHAAAAHAPADADLPAPLLLGAAHDGPRAPRP